MMNNMNKWNDMNDQWNGSWMMMMNDMNDDEWMNEWI